MKNFRNLYLLAGALAAGIILSQARDSRRAAEKDKASEISWSDFLSNVKKGKIKDATLKDDTISGEAKDGGKYQVRVALTPRLFDLIEQNKVPLKIEKGEDKFAAARVIDLLGTLLWIAVLVMIWRSFRKNGAGGGASAAFSAGTRAWSSPLPER